MRSSAAIALSAGVHPCHLRHPGRRRPHHAAAADRRARRAWRRAAGRRAARARAHCRLRWCVGELVTWNRPLHGRWCDVGRWRRRNRPCADRGRRPRARASNRRAREGARRARPGRRDSCAPARRAPRRRGGGEQRLALAWAGIDRMLGRQGSRGQCARPSERPLPGDPMRARPLAVLVSLLVVAPLARPAAAQAPGKFPPDSLVNTKVIPHNTPVTEVLGIMRNFTSDLGVRCGFCHVGKEGAPISSYDFASDEKRTKKTARQMMLMLAEVNRRLDTLPERKNPGLTATCGTCHRGVNRPVPLSMYVGDVAAAAGTDSAIKHVSRAARPVLRARLVRLRRAVAQHRRVPAGACRQVRRGARAAQAERGVLPEVVGDVRLPRQRAADARGHERRGRGVPRGGAPRHDELRGEAAAAGDRAAVSAGWGPGSRGWRGRWAVGCCPGPALRLTSKNLSTKINGRTTPVARIAHDRAHDGRHRQE